MYAIRSYYAKECLLFQGFDDKFNFPNDISLSASYKQAGNSVVVPVVKRIASKMGETMCQFDYLYKNKKELAI